MTNLYSKIANVNERRVKGEQALDEEEFLCFYKLLMVRPEISEIFYKYG